ncbi:MAG TPA: hypothetical protein VM266_17185 [Solirubrobacteraceae bacterium]|nr:hypothetical protein [Solirubrobacteraceae bacterium]
MNLFRSEEHVARWLGDRPPGATIGAALLCELAHAWWGDRLAPDWRPRTRDANQAILDGLGLTGPFWRLPLPAS